MSTSTMERTAATEEARAPRRTVRRTLQLLVAVGTLCVVLWMLASTLAPVAHSDNEVEAISPTVVEDEGVSGGLSDLHGHLNWVIWGSGDFDEASWLATIDATSAAMEDEGRSGVAAELAVVRQLVDEGAPLLRVHNELESVEFSWANPDQELSGTDG